MSEPVVVHTRVDSRPPLLWMAAAGLTLLCVVLGLVGVGYQTYLNRQVLQRINEQAAAATLAEVRGRQVADRAVERVLADAERRDAARDAELRRLLDEALALIAAEVRDPNNQEAPPPTLGPQPSPTPGPTATPAPRGTARPSPPRPSTTSPTPRPTRPGCVVPFLPFCPGS